MATVKKLRAEAICAICLDYFQDPVSIDCGHNFCRPCIVNCWEIRQQSFSCPQCRETTRLGSLRSNRELGNMVELVKTLRPEEAAEEDGGVCPRHREPLKLFCRQEEAPICVICRESREHRPHEVLPVEEAAEEYKDKILSEIQQLRREREDWRLTLLLNNLWLEKLEVELKLIQSEFEQLRQFADEQKYFFLGQLRVLQKEMEEQHKARASGSSEEVACLNARIRKLEEIQQLPGTRLLQGMKSILSRDTASPAAPSGPLPPQSSAAFSFPPLEGHVPLQQGQVLPLAPWPTERISPLQNPVDNFEFKQKLVAYTWRNVALRQLMKDFKETLMTKLPFIRHHRGFFLLNSNCQVR